MKKNTLIVSAILFSTALSAHADSTIYKWVDKNGVVSYSEEAPSDKQAKEVTTITVQSMPEDKQRAANRMIANLKKAANSDYVARMKEADQGVESALHQLEKAERELSEGSIPTGEDRVGMVNHKARLRESYFERVSDLQDQVDQARKDLTDAYTARDEIKP